jgi:hypothetical protein
VYTVPATLDLLYGGSQILYSDQSTDLLASVRSLTMFKEKSEAARLYFLLMW